MRAARQRREQRRKDMELQARIAREAAAAKH
jgi:hypothetical protein